MTVIELRGQVERLKGKRQQVEAALKDKRESLRSVRYALRDHEQAHIILNEVGLKTQQQLQVHISDITSLALESVFNDPYQLIVEFVQRRNKTECDLYFERDDQRIDPVNASGGGAVDVAAFSLRIASWAMATPRTRSTIILDEPFRFLSADNQEKASVMIKELSQRLGIQFIIVTHETILAAYADKTFEVKKKRGKSIVKL